jgi:translation elongation factor EF-Ts
MGKKKNKTLESVLFVITALDNKFSQVVVEQILKECDGDIEKAIEILRAISPTVSLSYFVTTATF